MRKLRIAILPHLGRPITRYSRAARSRVIYDLVHELTQKGHSVSLFGTEDSSTAAKNIPVAPTGVFLMGPTENDFYRHVSYLVQAINKLEKYQGDFDMVHNHMYPEFLPVAFSSDLRIPMLTTIHTEMTPYLLDGLRLFPKANLVALSKSHQESAKDVRIDTVVYNGIDFDGFPFSEKAKDYLLFIGRIKIIQKENGDIYDPKGILTAIEVAKKTNSKLLFSGSIETTQMYETYLKPHLSEKIKLVGEVSKEAPLSREEVSVLYQGARALLFPIHWKEPFGLVIIEANASGTPVIAFNRGAVPELIKNGVNGFIVNNTQEMIEAIKKVDQIDRHVCREYVRSRFSRQIMVENYEKLYYQLVK